MGIHGLMKLLSEECPGAIKEQEMENLTGRKVAVDASMAIYQFLIAVRSAGAGGDRGASMMLTNEAGEVTSHIQGMFNRTIKMMSSGVKPVFVFDGKPPAMKGGELAKRSAKREQAELELQQARENGEMDLVDKFSRRLVKANRQHSEDCKKLLRLMGVPVLEAPCEAEAQCAELAKKGKVYATATEDMDALTFRTPKLLRKLTFAAAAKQPILEIDIEMVLVGLELSYESFVDLCIMSGCDYCNTIRGIGPKTALKLIRQHKTIENIIKVLSKDPKFKHNIPEDWKPRRAPKHVDAEDSGLSSSVKAEEECLDVVKAESDSSTNATEVVNEAFNEATETNEPPSSSSFSSTSSSSPTPLLDGSDAETLKKTHSHGASLLDDDDDVVVDESGEENEATSNSASNHGKKRSSVVLDEDDEEEGAEPEIEIDISLLTSPSETEAEAKEDCEEDDLEGDGEIIEPAYVQARRLFLSAEVVPAESVDLKWTEPDEPALREFLVEQMGFQLERVNGGIKRLQEAQQKKSQRRMDSFFAPKPVAPEALAGAKRKAQEQLKGKNALQKGGKAAPGKGGNAFAKRR